MISKLTQYIRNGWRWQLLALIAGALLPLAFAPIDFWPASLLCVGVLAAIIDGRDKLQAATCGFLFALGMFASGVHWIFVPIDEFSEIPTFIALSMVFLFVLANAAVYCTVPFYILGRWCNHHPFSVWLGLPAAWVISEWLRTWLFTGFPWLFAGYSQIDTWLVGWAPITGVLGLSFFVALTASSCLFCWKNRHNLIRVTMGALTVTVIWLGGLGLKHVEWSNTIDDPIKVGLAQGNIPQELKWEESFLQPTLDRYQTLTNELWGNDWIIWPEAAIPMVANTQRDHARLQPYLADLQQQALQNNAALISGILYLSPENNKAYNSIMATGLGGGLYFKQRLVPFGEYAPLEEYLGELFNFFNIQRSMIALGPKNQEGLKIGNAVLAPSICYEIVYPDLVARGAKNSNVLITISNDAWFGQSIGPLQHMQMARMRAIETQRYLIRGTNNGVSALIDNKGQFIVRSERDVMQSLAGEINLKEGQTPLMILGSLPVVIVAFVLLGVLGFQSRNGNGNNK